MDQRVLSERRAGFTLVEVLIAMVILGIVLLGAQAALTDRLARDVGQQDKRTLAIQLAMNRLQALQLDPVYNALTTTYGGTESAPDNQAGFRRTTTVRRMVQDSADFTMVTVTVVHAALPEPVSRSLTIGAP